MHRSTLTYRKFVSPETYLSPVPRMLVHPAQLKCVRRDMDSTAAKASSSTPGDSLTSSRRSSTHAAKDVNPCDVSAPHRERFTASRLGADTHRTLSHSSVRPGYDRRLTSVRWHPRKSFVTRAVRRRVRTRSSNTRWLRSEGRTERSTRDASLSSSVSISSISIVSSSRSCQPSRCLATHRTDAASRESGGDNESRWLGITGSLS